MRLIRPLVAVLALLAALLPATAAHADVQPTISGRILLPDGSPAADALVYVYSWSSQMGWSMAGAVGRTDEDGDWTLGVGETAPTITYDTPFRVQVAANDPEMWTDLRPIFSDGTTTRTYDDINQTSGTGVWDQDAERFVTNDDGDPVNGYGYPSYEAGAIRLGSGSTPSIVLTAGAPHRDLGTFTFELGKGGRFIEGNTFDVRAPLRNDCDANPPTAAGQSCYDYPLDARFTVSAYEDVGGEPAVAPSATTTTNASGSWRFCLSTFDPTNTQFDKPRGSLSDLESATYWEEVERRKCNGTTFGTTTNALDPAKRWFIKIQDPDGVFLDRWFGWEPGKRWGWRGTPTSAGASSVPFGQYYVNVLMQLAPPAVGLTRAPAVVGTPIVGGTLSAGNATWAPAPATRTRQWQVLNGATWTAIEGATATTFRPVAAHGGKRLRVCETVTAAGRRQTTGCSAPTAAVLHGTLRATRMPAIAGTVKVGKTVTANVGAWTPNPTAYAYQWKVGSTVVSRARTYKIPKKYKKKKLVLVVTATRAGWAPSARTTAAKTIAK